MPRTQKTFSQRFAHWCPIALSALALSACEVGSSTQSKSVYRAASDGTSSVSATSSSAEVGHAVSVTVTVKDKAGYGISGVTPSITALNGSGSSTGVSVGGCSGTNANGQSTCSFTASLPGTYSVQILSPVKASGGNVQVYQVPRRLSFTTQPACSSCTAGVVLTTMPVVQLLDYTGALMNDANSQSGHSITTDSVTLSITGSAATLTGTTSHLVSASGVADFTGAGLLTTSSGTFTLTASVTDPVGGTITATSSSFSYVGSAATKLAFFQSPPSSTNTNVAFSPQPIVYVEDTNGNLVTSSTCAVTVALYSGGVADATDPFLGTLTVRAVGGIANFSSSNLIVASAAGGANFTLHATAATCGLTAADSSTFTISLSGTPDHIQVLTSPSSASLDQTWPTQPVVEVLDSNGSLVSTDNATQITVSTVSPSPAGTLSGQTTMTVVQGKATFAGLSTTGIASTAGTYVLNFHATNSFYTAINSANNDVTVAQQIDAHGLTPALLAFQSQPGTVSVNQEESAILVQTKDISGYLCGNDSTSSVVLQIGSGPAGGTMKVSGVVQATVTATVNNGIAEFDNVSFSKSGSYTLRATGTNGVTVLTQVTSSTIAVNPYSTGDHLNFSTQPVSTGSTVSAAWSTQPIVQVLDASGNLVTSDNSTVVTLTCGTPTSCALLGTTSRQVVNGKADFTGMGLRTSFTTAPTANVTVHAATTASLSATDSTAFTENPGATLPGTHLIFYQQPLDPSNTYDGNHAWTVQPVVEILDINNNVVTSDNTTQITVFCATPFPGTPACALIAPGGGAATTTVTVAQGKATFANLLTNQTHSGGAAISGISVGAAAAGYSSIVSGTFNGN